MDTIQLKTLLNEFRDNIKLDCDLKKKNWFNIGGKAKVFYKADNLKQLIKFLPIKILISMMIMLIIRQKLRWF